MANSLKSFLHKIIHKDQTGFYEREEYKGNNIRTIIDLIDYCDSNDIPGSIVLLDIEKHLTLLSMIICFRFLKPLILVLSSFNG